MIDDSRAIPSLPLRDRIVVGSALGATTALAWLYLIRMPMAPADLGGAFARILSMMPPRFADAWFTFMMWAVMMVAMMLPSAAPMVLTYARIAHGRSAAPTGAAAMFAVAYVLVWTAFSATATIGQIALDRAAMLTGALAATPLAGGAILLTAGLYQLTPLKEACLGYCRSPIGFFMTEWRDGAAGAFVMGLRHGTFCVGCCWMLMALLFVAGVMNLLWIAALSVFVLLEKALPYGRVISRVSGVAMLVAGAVELLSIFAHWM